MGTGAGFRAGTLMIRLFLKKAGPERWNGTAKGPGRNIR